MSDAPPTSDRSDNLPFDADTAPDLLAQWPGLPRDAGEPVFHGPWQAQAFAMAVALHAQGLFTWPEWAEALAGQIKQAQAEGDADRGDSYYAHWLATLEVLVAAKGAASPQELARTRVAWQHAAERTPHGQPLAVRPDDFGAA